MTVHWRRNEACPTVAECAAAATCIAARDFGLASAWITLDCNAVEYCPSVTTTVALREPVDYQGWHISFNSDGHAIVRCPKHQAAHP